MPYKPNKCIGGIRMDCYKILYLEQDKYEAMIIICSVDSPFDYMDEISLSLISNKINGPVLFDQIFHSGNNEERFIEAEFKNGEFIKSSFKFKTLFKNSEYRRMSHEYLVDSGLLEGSILSSHEKKLMNKGVTI